MAAVGRDAGARGRSWSQVCHHLRDTDVIGATGQVLVHVNSLGMAGQDSLKNEVFFLYMNG